MALRRERAIERIRRRLLKRGWPRLQVSIALFIAGLIGFLASFGMLSLGLANMGLRYPLAACVGYAAFLLILRATARHGLDFDADPLDALDGSSSDDSPPSDGGSGDFDFGVDLPLPDIDEGIVFLIPLAILIAGVGSSIYVIYVAPALVAELIVDAVLVASLARRLRRGTPQHWIHGALRHTFLPFLALLITLTAAGFLGNHLVPGADSIGDLLGSVEDTELLHAALQPAVVSSRHRLWRAGSPRRGAGRERQERPAVGVGA